MLMRKAPFRELDRLTQQVFDNAGGTWSRPIAMPMYAYRPGDQFVVSFDLPGVPGGHRARRRTQRADRQGPAAPGHSP
jgi:hypothetical protein